MDALQSLTQPPAKARSLNRFSRLVLHALALPWIAYASLAFPNPLPFGETVVKPFLAAAAEERLGTRFPRFEIEVGEPDPRLQLAPCKTMEPFVPPGVQLWGATRLGIRCTDGATWRITVPAHIRVHGPALQLVQPIASGQPVTEADVEDVDVELSRMPVGSWLTREQLNGKVAARPLVPGVTLRQNDLKQPMTIASGDLVTIVLRGNGFSISGEGKALGAGYPGQSLRVQVMSGKILQGTVRSGRQVEVMQ
ncbi:MAG: flagellar basal body P-ring formation chaperone FlgA [Burkholderiales bacterium]|nr:flagellar basal body P-ring formation chaperone FlgA [Burkholderiales bacterium]